MRSPDDALIDQAARVIRRGGLVVFPTETVYGLGANALDPAAVARIYQVKGRPPTSPLIVHVASLEQAQSLVSQWPERAQLLAERYWPGPLTLVLPKSPLVPDVVTAGLPTVGIRMPRHPVALELIRRAGVPVAAPSANPFSQLSPTRAEHVEGALPEVDLVLDGGPSEVGIESTVLSLASDPPVLFRPGAISREELEAVIGPIVRQGPAAPAHPSPGLHPKHYAPRTPLVLVADGALPPGGRGVYVWAFRRGSAPHAVQLPADPVAYAARLYETLHELDRQGWDWIAVEMPPATPAWEAVRDRLLRAAGLGSQTHREETNNCSATAISSGRPTSSQIP